MPRDRTIWLAAIALSTSAPAAMPLQAGSVSIEPGARAEAPPPVFVAAVGDALAAHGFTLLDQPGHSAYVAQLVVRRADVGTGAAAAAKDRNSVSPGLYGGVGAGVTLPLGTNKSVVVPLQRTELEIRLRRRGDEAVMWHGAAATVRAAGTRAGAEAAVAADLSEAILQGYPAEPDAVVGVP